MKQHASIVTLIAILLLAFPAHSAVEVKQGDSIVFVGNTFSERLALSGYFDALAHAAHPDKKLVIRHVPNSADEVDNMPREMNVPPADFYLKQHGADVVFMCFGMSESFDGLDGVEAFKAGLTKQVKHHQGQKYNGELAPQIVLVSPIAHEDLGAPLPTGDAVNERNDVLKAYAEAVKQVASETGVHAIDLFTPSAGLYTKTKEPLTSNGIAPSEAGCFHFAAEIARQLGWWDGKTVNGGQDRAAALRQIAYDKHYHFRHRYRATNTEYVWGRRHKPFGIQNFPTELKQLDRMVAVREAAIWAMDKPTVGQLFAKAPLGKAIWETFPESNSYAEDTDWSVPKLRMNNKRLRGDTIKPGAELLSTFTLPEGYKIDLFASEADFKDVDGKPLLANPLAMTFDYKGRLWLICSPTYPHPLPGETSNCKLLVLEDTKGDGKADKCTVFADKMNIPTGFAVDTDCVYVGQAPDLWKLSDTDGDGKSDRREIVYSGFGMPDSHHTICAFQWDPNGGFVMLEGVFMKTNIETPYGTQRTHDAAVWRFDPRTQKLIAISHTEHPNPWGITYDEFGQAIMMDTSEPSHYNFSALIVPFVEGTKPPKDNAMLKRGRPTAGNEIIYSRHFPDEVQGTHLSNQCIGFLGTRWDRLTSDGAKHSGYQSEPMPQDLISGKDPNFRPVAMEIGPDGSLFVVDWCNPLIGHAQFNVRDPRRDRTHGRIWRVTYPERDLIAGEHDLTKLSMGELFEKLKVPEQNTRQLARRLLQRMSAGEVSKAATDWLFKLDPRDPEYDRLALEALWVQQGAGKIDMKVVDEVARARDARARAGGLRVIRYALQYGEMDSSDAKRFIETGVTDRDMRVRLEAVVACAYLDDPSAADIANRVSTQEMDNAMRIALKQTADYIRSQDPSSKP